MKKISFLLFAALFAVAANAEVMQIWNSDQVVYQQSTESIDSLTFATTASTDAIISFSSDNVLSPDNICKTWTGQAGSNTITLTFFMSDDESIGYFSYTHFFDDGPYSMTDTLSGRFLIQGNLILMCASQGSIYVPTVYVYYNGTVYGDPLVGTLH